jgi:perosamine synthetase
MWRRRWRDKYELLLRQTEVAATQQNRIPLAKPVIDDEMKEAALQALQNERLVLGESVFKFEAEFARYCETEFAVSTASGTAALALSLIAEGVGGGEVITTPASFVASANSIIHAAATPKFADINLRDYTIDPAKIRSSLSDRTRAIVPVHLFGFPAQMDEIRRIASERGISVIEDACQAHGALWKGKRAGSVGDVGCFSFFSSKNMTVGGDGGMVVTDDESTADSIRSLRDCGRAKGSKYLHTKVGFTERLNTVQAAIGRIQLKRLDKWNESRRAIASEYDALLSDLDDLTTPPTGSATVRPVYHMYVIRSSRRDDLRAWLDRAEIETGIHYPDPIHLQPVYREMFGYRGGEFPNSETFCKSCLSIPMHPNLSRDEVRLVSDSIHQFYDQRS